LSNQAWAISLRDKWTPLSVGRKIFLIAYSFVVIWALGIVTFYAVGSSEPTASSSTEGAIELAPQGGPAQHFIRYRNAYDSSRGADDRGVPAWRRFAAAAPAAVGRPMIAIVIDDMGPNQKNARRAMTMPAPLTLSFLPYADDLTPMVTRARANGHEVLLHLPMEPKNGKVHSPGPNSLMTNLQNGELTRRLIWNLERFKGYVGINNHMGSRFTSDANALAPVMAELRARGLLFLDSRTTTQSAGRRVAKQTGVPYGRRDIFLDNERSATQVAAQLREVEAVARQNGIAIAIGHPHDQTLDALEQWIGDLEQRGFVLVPVSAVVAHTYRIAAGKK